ncbi:uncharacterized protein LOC133926930 isoform X2 [Phragmites australis]|uniref:uncharacterized protein LOC133926930 isoform X2 n=2 Tax=Phragmites australis TaxID=29695 RepID=UPI002D769CDB|nr:uncharacterized protein LOC133926930 isoform X2 [Phragmites australis]
MNGDELDQENPERRRAHGPARAVQDLQEALARPSPGATEMTGRPRSSATLPALATTLSQVEKNIIATGEPCRTAKAQENMEFGASIAAFSASMMVAWYFLSPEARGAHNLCYIIPMLLGFACFICGVSLMLLSMNILELTENIVADVQEMASKILSSLCSTLPVVTMLSPLVLCGSKVYKYIGLTLLVMVTAPLALQRWYIGSKAERSDEQAADNEHMEQLEAGFKFISAITNSASGGLFGLLVNYNVTGGSGRTKGAVLVAIFFIFATAIWGLLSMEIRTKVLEIKSPKLRGFIIQAMWDSSANVSLKVHFNLKTDKGIKLTMWSFTAIIGIFGGFLHDHDKIQSLKACLILLTSAFMSGFALTVVTMKPDLSSTSFAAATTVLDWSGAAAFAAAIFSIIVAMVLEIL